MSNQATKIEKAMAQLILHQPFFATILMRMRVIESPERPTMSTDGKHLWYNPEFVETLTEREVEGVLCHEALHPAMLHHLRKNGREHWKWNRACDYAINPIVLDAGMRLPKDALFNEEWKEMSAEEIYLKLDDTPPCPPTPPGGPCEEGEGGSSGESQPDTPDNSDTEADSNDMTDSSSGITDSLSEDEGDNGGEGTAPDGTCQWGQVDEPKASDDSELSASEKEEQEAKWKVMLQQAADTAKKAGKLPAGMDKLIEDLMEPKLDWRTVLARWAGDMARTDFSFRFPNKRFIQSGFILPSLKSETIGKVIFAVDTSGSMHGGEMRDVLSEVCGAIREYEKDGVDPEITVLWCDTEVHEQQISDPDEFNPKGNGGTEYEPVFDYIEENGLDPKAVVYLTDGYCYDYNFTPPDCPVLWALTNKLRSFKPPFGEIMVINQ